MNKLIATLLFWTVVSGVAEGQELRLLADSLRQAHAIPELGFAVVSQDSILAMHILGYHRQDLQSAQTKARPSDYFHLGSNTKAITGFVAACLVETNAIKWTTRFFDLFPEWQQGSHPAYQQITLADLLSHRARIQPYTSGAEYRKLPAFAGSPSERRRQFSKYLLTQAPVESNKDYTYSNAGYTLAAVMLEKVSGKSWEQLTKEVMATHVKVNVAYGWPNRLSSDQPFGHWLQNDSLKALPPEIGYDLTLGEPAGDISMTLPDYARFIQLNLQGLAGKDNVLQASTYRFLHFGLKGYAIGWGNVQNETQLLSEHAGSAGTFFAYTLVDAKQGRSYIIIANSGTPQAQEGVFKLLQVLRARHKP